MILWTKSTEPDVQYQRRRLVTEWQSAEPVLQHRRVCVTRVELEQPESEPESQSR